MAEPDSAVDLPFRENLRDFSEFHKDESDHYTTPLVVDLGAVRDLTKGSSGSGTADANSQYYWA